jgi:hypothetical protein
MTNKTQNILIFAVMAILITLVVVWFYLLNEGKLIVTTGVNDYVIYANNLQTICPKDPCEIKLKIGRYDVRFEKDGFNTASSQITITRGEITAVKFEAKKKMEIEKSSGLPSDVKPAPSIPKELNEKDIIASKWNAENSRFLFLDKNDGRLKIMEPGGEIKLITTLKNIPPPINFYWSPGEKYILAGKESGLYFIDVNTGSRKKQVLDFIPEEIIWSKTDDFLLANGESNSLYKIYWANPENTEKLDIALSLGKSVWINDTTLMTYDTDVKNNQTEIWTYDLANMTRESLAAKFDFPINKIIYNPEQNTAYFYNERESGWYEMKM